VICVFSSASTGPAGIPRWPLGIALALAVALVVGVLIAAEVVREQPLGPLGLAVVPAPSADSMDCARLLAALRRSGRKPRIIILRMDQVPYIDSSGASALEEFVRQAAREGTQIILCDLRAQPDAFLAKLWPNFEGARRAATFQAALDEIE